MICEMCNEVIFLGKTTKHVIKVVSTHYNNDGNTLDFIESLFCSLKCFCRYSVKIAVVNQSELNMDYSDYEDYIKNSVKVV